MSDPTDSRRGEPIDADYAPAPERPRGRRGVGFATVAACSTAAALAGGALGVIAPRTALGPALDALAPDTLAQLRQDQSRAAAEIAALKSQVAGQPVQIAQMDARLGAFESAVATPLVEAAGADNLPPATLAGRLIGLQSEVDAVEARLAQTANVQQVAALGTELETLKLRFADVAAEAGRAARAAASAYAVTAATEAARSAGPFEPAYAALSALLPDDPNVKALAPFAATGAPTFGELADEFRGLELDIVRAARIAEAGGGLTGRVQAWLANFVVVRRTDEVGTSATDIVARTAGRMEADDLASAVNELSKLSGPPAKIAAPWLARAKARVEIDARLAALRAELAKGTATQ
jgi:hypothetical protein